MRFAFILLFLVQDEAPLSQERERIRTKPPLTASEKAGYATPAGPPLKPKSSYQVAVVPLEFSDQRLGTTDLSKLFFGRVNEYFARVSSGRFKLEGRVSSRNSMDWGRAQFERKDLERFVGGLPPCQGVAFVTAGGMASRGSPLWPHRGVVHAQDRNIDYVLVPESASVAVLAHEFMHLLGLEDKYDDEKASVADECIMGTGYSIVNPPPPCAECRIKLGWTSAATVDPAMSSAVTLGPDLGEAIRVPLNPEGDETLLLEMRERLLVWHTGGGRKIELLGRFPSDLADRLTPLSEPSFRGRSVGARQVWMTDIRIQDGKTWFRVGPEAPLTALEEWHRSHIGKVLKD
ncbi:MAG TPA: immune inhibitor A domain-containing protein [Planctomycetota bacterium]|jgi:hypothetical protein|nr:immune inhibitor A domain-containing protein [Planctomycetota bacterium]